MLLCLLPPQGGENLQSFFGSVAVASRCWILLCEENPTLQLSKLHLLYALLYLKVNPTDGMAAQILLCHEQTYRAWRDYYVELISKLPIVSIS